MKFKLNSKILSPVLMIATALSMTAFPLLTFAVGITAATDVMSSQAPNVTSDHTITWTQGTGHATTAGDTIAFAFTTSADFTANVAASWQTTDFSLTDTNHAATAPLAVGAAPSCSATNNYTVTISGTVLPVFTVTLCSAWVSSTSATAVTFVIKGATGGTGTLTNRNGDVNSSPLTITDTGSNTDTTTIAVVIETNDIVTVTATVNPTLTFAISSPTVSLGTLSTSARTTGSHTVNVATNAAGGFLVTYNGASLTPSGGGAALTAYTALHAPTIGTEGWGINLKANTTPSFGANPVTNSGATCNAATNYNTADQYTFIAGATTAITNTLLPADCTYTVSYMANISTTTLAGSYSTDLTYIASGSF